MTTQAEPIDVTAHMALVRWAIRRRGFAPRAVGALEYEDFLQEGALGLIRAAQTYDSAKGSWANYAAWWLRHNLDRSWQNKGSTVRVPIYLQERRRRAGERPVPYVRRLDVPITQGSDTTLADLLAADAPSPEDVALAAEREAELSTLMWRARLSPRERRVLALRSHDVSLESIGAELGLTRERVRQIESGAIAKLRRAAGVIADTPRVPISRAESKSHGGKRRRKPTNRLETKAPCRMPTTPQPESV